MTDVFIRGTLGDINYRYIAASAFRSIQHIWITHRMQPQPAVLLGQAAMAAFLLSARGTKEDDQTVGLHFECDGPIRRLITFGRFDGGLRGQAAEPSIHWNGSIEDGKGSGMLTVSLFQDHSRKVYGSSVAFDHRPISNNIMSYIEQSEQVHVLCEIGVFTGDTISKISDSIDNMSSTGIYGIFFEALPGASNKDQDALLHFLSEESRFRPIREQGQLPILPGILAKGNLFSYCDCSREKIERLIIAMGKDEAMQIVKEFKKIEVTCEFCCKKYQFTEPEVAAIFVEDSV